MVPAETHSHQQPIDRDAIAAIVCEQLAEILGIDVDSVTLDARLREDLDADDFALIDLADAVEAELGERSVGLTLDDDDLAEVRTVGDAVEVLVARLAARSGS
jgi:acyl carrier protein